MTAPQWFLDTQRDMAKSVEMEWIEPDVDITPLIVVERALNGWRYIHQAANPSPTASKEYGRHWVRTIKAPLPEVGWPISKGL